MSLNNFKNLKNNLINFYNIDYKKYFNWIYFFFFFLKKFIWIFFKYRFYNNLVELNNVNFHYFWKFNLTNYHINYRNFKKIKKKYSNNITYNYIYFSFYIFIKQNWFFILIRLYHILKKKKNFFFFKFFLTYFYYFFFKTKKQKKKFLIL